jgi:hypothetical protein
MAIKEEESCRIRKYSEVQGQINIYKKSLRLTWYGHIERTNKEAMPKQIVPARMKETIQTR